MQFKKIIFFALLFFFANSLYVKLIAAPKNLEVLDSIFKEVATKIYKDHIKSRDTTYYRIFGDDVSWLLEKKLLELKKHHILININNSNIDTLKGAIKIIIEDVFIEFNHLENSPDFLSRLAKIKLSIINNLEAPAVDTIEVSYLDTLDFKELNTVNKSNFGFAIANAPEKKRTCWEKFIEPVILVTTAAITTFLFFSVRSK